jgi:glycosyltransferase involved in cell wall biosynthesis
MRIVQANAVYDVSLKTPDALLDAYHTLTEWSTALSAAGASVSVVQRFHADATIERDGVTYRFVRDREVPWLSTTSAPPEFIDAVVAQRADVIHVNGLIFPAVIAALREKAGQDATIIAQHHGGEFPIRGSGFIGAWQRRGWRRGLADANAISFTAADQADTWQQAGLLSGQPIVEIVEASTSLRPAPRERARAIAGVDGDPVILWVGRLTTNKDPLTVVDGVERAMGSIDGARLLMIFGDDTLLPDVEARVSQSRVLRDIVTLVGRVDRNEMPNYYGAADVYVSGSHAEGSGYALIEAMAAGLIPVVTDIPSFRVIAGDAGRFWSSGDPDSLALAIGDAWKGDRDLQRAAVSKQFDEHLSWPAIASRTLSEYQSVIDSTRRAAP